MATDYTAFGNAERVTLSGYSGDAMEPFLSRDGKYLFFNSLNDAPNNASEDKNIYYATYVDGTTFAFQGVVGGVNTVVVDGVPTMDNTNTFYYVSTALYQPPNYASVYRGTFDGSSGNVSGIAPVANLAEGIAGHLNFDVEISADGRTLYFADGVFSGNPFPDVSDLAYAVDNGSGFVRNAAIMANLNTADLEYAAGISANGLELFFTRLSLSTLETTIYRATRPDMASPFGPPQRVSAISGFVEAPSLSPDEKSLYYHKNDGGKFVIYRVTRP